MSVACSVMDEPLTLLSIHAHPDDESSKGASTVARYATEGIKSVLVTCTGGEEGDILNDELDHPHIRENLAEVRRKELEEAVRIIGYDRLHLLGYRDSGMPDSDANGRADNFANATLDEAAGRLAAIIRAEKPHVIITYSADQKRYPHPDHLRVYDITEPAIERAADPNWMPDPVTIGVDEHFLAGHDEIAHPWQVKKVYWSTGFTRGRILTMHNWFEEQGEESPFVDWVAKIPDDADDAITTRINIADTVGVGRDALAAHRTQVAPGGWWFKMPLEVMAERHPWESYTLASSLVGKGEVDDEGFETDLFGGLR